MENCASTGPFRADDSRLQVHRELLSSHVSQDGAVFFVVGSSDWVVDASTIQLAFSELR